MHVTKGLTGKALLLGFLLMAGCASTSSYDEFRGCQNYEPTCEFLGATKECSYTEEGCRSCTCKPIPGSVLDRSH